jgi:hypothetical protein
VGLANLVPTYLEFRQRHAIGPVNVVAANLVFRETCGVGFIDILAPDIVNGLDAAVSHKSVDSLSIEPRMLIAV